MTAISSSMESAIFHNQEEALNLLADAKILFKKGDGAERWIRLQNGEESNLAILAERVTDATNAVRLAAGPPCNPLDATEEYKKDQSKAINGITTAKRLLDRIEALNRDFDYVLINNGTEVEFDTPLYHHNYHPVSSNPAFAHLFTRLILIIQQILAKIFC